MTTLCWCILGVALSLQHGLPLARSMDPCVPNPCPNGRKCTVIDFAYLCSCPEGKYGTECEYIEENKTSEEPLKLTTIGQLLNATDLSSTASQDSLQSTVEPSNSTSDLTDAVLTLSNDTSETFNETDDGRNDKLLIDQMTTPEETATDLSSTASQNSLQSTVEPSNSSSNLTDDVLALSNDTSQAFNETDDGRNDKLLIDEMTTPATDLSNTASQDSLQSPEVPSNSSTNLTDDDLALSNDTSQTSNGTIDEQNVTSLIDQMTTQVINENNQIGTLPPTSPIENQDQDQRNPLLVLLLMLNVNLCTYSPCHDGFTCKRLDRGYQCELMPEKDCKDNCSEPFVRTDCMCLKTCNNMANSSPATECLKTGDIGCQKGCQCPDGMVMHNNTCINGADCPCYYGGLFYKLGESVQSATEPCSRFTCKTDGLTTEIDTECLQGVYGE